MPYPGCVALPWKRTERAPLRALWPARSLQQPGYGLMGIPLQALWTLQILALFFYIYKQKVSSPLLHFIAFPFSFIIPNAPFPFFFSSSYRGLLFHLFY